MKEIKKYEAYDGTIFDTRTECEEYESEGLSKQISNVHIRMQQLKAGELAEMYQRYAKALANYRRVCTEEASLSERSKAVEKYVAVKTLYTTTVQHYNGLKKQYKRLKLKEEQRNAKQHPEA